MNWENILLSRLTLPNLALASLYAGIGIGAFLFLLGRFFFPIREGFPKRILIISSFLGLTGVGAWIGFFQGETAWSLLPVSLLILGIIMEIRRLQLRRNHKATDPVEVRARPMSLFRPVTTYDLSIARYEVPLAGLTQSALRVIHISDLHLHAWVRKDFYVKAIEQINGLHPDLIFITGDFILRNHHRALLPEFLSRLHPRTAIIAVLGNHDYWLDSQAIVSTLQGAGVHVLQNSSTLLKTPGGDSLLIAGCDDPWTGYHWQTPQRAGKEPFLVLTHTADNIYKLSEAGADAVFTGHFHAGHFSVPLLGPLVIPSRYGRRFYHGHYLVKNTHLFVTAGLGAAFPPIRLYCQPEIQIIDFTVPQHGLS